MYIKTVVVDGFKSYAQRTEISGFDPKFNAITGLNGSGKSNILDSICFLLGISNLTQVRATNLQELVYKNGQAGVTKATVCITFDNSDKKQSPLGYEQYDEITVTRQVVIGGRNKYLINGSNANNTRVQDLFRSVQLNVNNPHFLIMQGRITKVLNMKPPEILSMIEEAAGTKLYESKKETAQKTIEKKDAKLNEIDTILKEEINPTLAKLKDERSSYLEYQKVIRELEHLNKLVVAYQFVSAEQTRQKSAEDLTAMTETVKKLKDRKVEIADKIKELDQIIDELEKRRDEEAGGAMQQLESILNEKQKEDAKSQSTVQNKKDAVKAEQKKLKDINKNYASDQSTVAAKQKELLKIGKDLEKLQEKSTEAQNAHENAKKHLHAVSAGLSTNQDGEDASLNDQLITAKKDISNAETEQKQAEMRLKHAQQEIKKKQADLKKTEQGYKSDESTLDAVKKNSAKLEAELKKLNYTEGKEEELSEKRRNLNQEVHTLREKVDAMQARFPQLQFQYRDPEKNFDRRKVHGLIAKLIQVKDPNAATALEVSSGGKLYNVVVDNEVTSKKLIEKGELKRRYTIIPLNKISAREIGPEVVKKAESLVGKNNVCTALSLVGFEKDVQAAMQYVFGSAFVCKNMDFAKKVTFDPQIMKKSVTLEGDSFDPAGTLTGGSRPQTGSILAKLTEFKEAEKILEQKQNELNQLEVQLNSIRGIAARYTELKRQYELKQSETQLLDEKLKQSTHGQQLSDIEELQKTIDEQQETLKSTKEIYEKNSKKVADLDYKIKNAKSLREKELKDSEQEVTKSKKMHEDANKKTKEKQQEVESAKLEITELEKDIGGYEEQIKAVEEAIKGFEEQVKQVTEASKQTKDAVADAQKALAEQKEKLKSCNKDIETRATEKRKLQKETNNAELQLQKLDHDISKSTKDSKDAARRVEDMLQRYEWIADEKKYFGQANTAYDFEANDPKEASRRLQKLQDTKEKLSKNVNMRAMNMLGKAEEQYNDLMKKRRIVLNDKEKIASVIAELDEKKNEALKKAHTQVNKDFGSIFSTLLPGTQAKLVAPDGLSILDGLEVKIAFGDVWKESLQELSGGQRSLVALSLILSLLLFKPAPLYILDEVDAALDLSHTQNIGQMLRTHFRHSQFIVVSLKDGMFNNANVLFKTKFVDGVSTVTRYAQSQSRPVATSSSSHGGREAGKKSKKARRDQDILGDIENVA